MAFAEGRALYPVLACGRAEPPAPVARRVHVDPVAVRCGAHAEPVVQLAAEDGGQPGGAAGRPPRGQGRLVGGVEVDVPGLAVVPFQDRVRPSASASVTSVLLRADWNSAFSRAVRSAPSGGRYVRLRSSPSVSRFTSATATRTTASV